MKLALAVRGVIDALLPKQFPGRRYSLNVLAGTLSLTPWLQPVDDEGRGFRFNRFNGLVLRNRCKRVRFISLMEHF